MRRTYRERAAMARLRRFERGNQTCSCIHNNFERGKGGNPTPNCPLCAGSGTMIESRLRAELRLAQRGGDVA